jgi:DNA-binding ferritin-like protein
MKTACGNCGSKTGCGCSTPSPYDSTEVVWHDPTKYDATKHGPSYLPGRTRLASSQKAEVRAFVKQAAAPGLQDFPETSPLSMVLTFMRALSHVHKSHHWQTRGTSFYADHLLFERLNSESLDFIDQVAERAVGVYGPAAVDPFLQASGIQIVVAYVCGHTKDDPMQTSLEADSPELMVERSLRGEVKFLKVLEASIGALTEFGKLSPGTSNLLEGVSDKHETFVYLLRQRSGARIAYTYER